MPIVLTVEQMDLRVEYLINYFVMYDVRKEPQHLYMFVIDADFNTIPLLDVL